MKAPAATPANNKIKFKFNMRLHKTTGKALKAELAKATKAAKNIKKALAKETKKASAKDPKKDKANVSKEDEGQGVQDFYIEQLDLQNRGLESVEMGPSNTNKVEDWIEKTLYNLSLDQV